MCLKNYFLIELYKSRICFLVSDTIFNSSFNLVISVAALVEAAILAFRLSSLSCHTLTKLNEEFVF
jgi:hypothetical protein